MFVQTQYVVTDTRRSTMRLLYDISHVYPVLAHLS